MKRFITKSSIFLVTLISIFGILEFFVFPKSNNEMALKHKLLTNQLDVDVIILGNSHTFFGINPDESNFKMINIANMGRKLETDYYILRDYIGKQNKIKFVILPISGYSLLSGELSSNEKRLYYNFFNIHEYSQSFFKNYLIFNEPFKELVDNLFFYNKNLHNKFITNLGWRPVKGNYIKDINHIKARLKDIEGDKGYFKRREKEIAKNLMILQGFSDLQKKYQFKLVIVLPPHHLDYYKYSDQEYYEFLNKTMNSFLVKNNEIIYIEGKKLNIINDSLFHDEDHLNINGATVFTKKIDSILKRNL